MLSGSEEQTSFCVDNTSLATCLVLEVTSGGFDYEVSWTLADAATGGLAFALEGGAPYAYASDNVQFLDVLMSQLLTITQMLQKTMVLVSLLVLT